MNNLLTKENLMDSQQDWRKPSASPSLCLRNAEGGANDCFSKPNIKINGQEALERRENWEWDYISISISTAIQEPLLHLAPVSSPTIPLKWKPWFLLKPTAIAFVRTLHVHIAVKLKSRLLKPSVILALGKYVAGGHHIRMLQLKKMSTIKTNKTLTLLNIISGSHLL